MMHGTNDRVLSPSFQSSLLQRGVNRRRLLQRSAAVGLGMTAVPLLGRRAAAQDIPRAQSSATVTGTLRVLLKDDFHPDHNAFMRAELQAFADAQGWPIEITDVAGYQGGGDLNQMLLGAVQAGNAPDLLIQDVGVRNMVTLGVLQPVDDLVNEMIETYGEVGWGHRLDSSVDDVWYAVPFFTRAGGLYVRQDIFEEAGLDVDADTETYDALRDAALAVSNPSENMWGWGMTVNRSGDGNSLVTNVIYRHGGHVQDEAGEIVTLNSPETVAALEWLAEIYTAPEYADMLPPGVLSWTDPSNNEAYLAGQTAITDNAGTVYAKAVLDDVPFWENITFLPRPVRMSDNARLEFLSGMKFYLITDAVNADAVADVTRHFMTLPVQEEVWRISTSYALPAYLSGWDNPIITENANSMRARDIALNETDFTGLRWPGPYNEAIGSIESGVFFTDMMGEILQGRPAAEVVADYHQQFVQIYQDFGLPGE
jgi:multiple sugar transport system substrate-binding protein